MFGSPPIDSHRLRNRDLRNSKTSDMSSKSHVEIERSEEQARRTAEKKSSKTCEGHSSKFLNYVLEHLATVLMRLRFVLALVRFVLDPSWHVKFTLLYVLEHVAFVGYIALPTVPRSHVTTWLSG